MKKISIIIPCYNVETYIRQCIDSLTNQTIGVDSLEIIAVNDASTDHTLEVLTELEQAHPQSILVVDCAENGRQGRARNIGLSYASADYICFVDADDWLELTACEKMYRIARKYDCDAVCSDYYIESTRDSTSVGSNGKQDQFYIIENDTDRGAFVGIDCGQGVMGNLYRRSMLIEHEIYYPEGCFYEDEYWYVLSMHYIDRCYILGEYLYHYYQHPDSTIHKRNSLHQLDRALVEELKLQELVKRGIFARFPSLYEHEFLQHYYMQMLYILFTQFDQPDYEVIRTLHDNAYHIFPHYRQNPFVQRILRGKGGAYMQHVYEQLDQEFTDAVISTLYEECISTPPYWVEIRI